MYSRIRRRMSLEDRNTRVAFLENVLRQVRTEVNGGMTKWVFKGGNVGRSKEERGRRI